MFLRRRAPEPGTCATVLRKCSAQRGRRTAKKRAVSRRGPEVARCGDTRPAPTARQRPGSAEAHGDLRTRGLIPPRAVRPRQVQELCRRTAFVGDVINPPAHSRAKGGPGRPGPGHATAWAPGPRPRDPSLAFPTQSRGGEPFPTAPQGAGTRVCRNVSQKALQELTGAQQRALVYQACCG